jgi:archaellum component FlaC
MEWIIKGIEVNQKAIEENMEHIARLEQQIKALKKHNKDLAKEINGYQNLLIVNKK